MREAWCLWCQSTMLSSQSLYDLWCSPWQGDIHIPPWCPCVYSILGPGLSCRMDDLQWYNSPWGTMSNFWKTWAWLILDSVTYRRPPKSLMWYIVCYAIHSWMLWSILKQTLTETDICRVERNILTMGIVQLEIYNSFPCMNDIEFDSCLWDSTMHLTGFG